MFKFLKEKLKNVVNKFSRKIDEEGVEEVEEVSEVETSEHDQMSEKQGFSDHTQKSKISDESSISDKVEDKPEQIEEIKEKEKEEKEIKEKEKEDKKQDKPGEEKEIKEKQEQTQEPIKKKISEGKTPSIYELAQRKKEKKVQPKIEVVTKQKQDIEKEPEQIPKPIPEIRQAMPKLPTPKKPIKQKQEPEKVIKVIKPFKEEPKQIQESAEEEEETKPTADQLIKQVEEEDKPPKEDKDLTADELIKESAKLVLPEDKILTAKQIQEKFAKERETKKKEKQLELEKQVKKPELEPEPEAKGFFEKIKQKFVTKKINEKQFDEIFWDLEVALMENNVALEVIEKIKLDLKQNLVDQPIRRGKIPVVIENSLKNSIIDLFDVEKYDIINKIQTYKEKEKKPFIICFLGINGSGKTTSIAKFVQLLKNNNLTCVISAADTFRAAAIQQLEEHGSKLNTKVIKHDYGADAAAVAFDSVKYAEAHNIDVVLIDTAGRMHSNVNLMDELKKIIRVNEPNLNIFVGESITGNDCVDQAKKFNQAVGIDGVILTKADVDEKGGASISVSYVTKKPILFLGIGQGYNDLEEFDKDKIINNLFE